jgi:hypothetical protein
MGKKYTYDEIKQEFNDRGYILITDHKVKSNEKYEYVCQKHQDKGSQFIDWGHFHCSGRGCYYCGRERTEAAKRKDLSEYDGKSLAESKGFEYVGMARHDQKIWVQFICPNHRQYGVQEMPYNNMKRVVVGCQHCIGRNDNEQEVLSEMKEGNPNIIILELYAGRTKKILMKCLVHNVECLKTPADVINGGGCYLCGINKVKESQFISQEEFEDRVRRKNPHIRIDSQYTGSNNLIDCYCLKHNISFARVAVSLYNDHSGCDECHKELVRQVSGLTKEQYIEMLQCNFPYINLLGDYITLQHETDFYCNQCRMSWVDKPILVRNRGCPRCENNCAENLVGQVLNTYNIKYQRQYVFDDCVDRRKLPFDYFLIDYNILCEYDGEQHYYPVGFGCKDEQESYDKFAYTKRHDQIKDQYCLDHNIPLIRIPYWEKNNINKYLINELIKIGVPITKNN